MSEIVALTFEGYFTADKALRRAQELQKKHQLDLEDACVVRKDQWEHVKLRQALSLVGMGIVTGSCWGALIGLLIGGPLGAVIGMASGATLGGLGGKFSDYGIADSFMLEASKAMPPSSSAVFMLLKRSHNLKILAALKEYGGKVVYTSLNDQQDRELRDSFENQAA